MMFEESTSSMSCGTTNAKGTRVALVFDGSKEKFEEYWEKLILLFTVNEMDHLLSKDIPMPSSGHVACPLACVSI